MEDVNRSADGQHAWMPPERLRHRHAFTHERVLMLIAYRSGNDSGVTISKRELAESLRVCLRSVDRAVTTLRSHGFVMSVPRYSDCGAQLGNEYRITEAGLKRATMLMGNAERPQEAEETK